MTFVNKLRKRGIARIHRKLYVNRNDAQRIQEHDERETKAHCAVRNRERKELIVPVNKARAVNKLLVVVLVTGLSKACRIEVKESVVAFVAWGEQGLVGVQA